MTSSVQTALPTGRFVAIDSPAALPGCCVLCRGHKGPFIDTALSHQGHGALYICSTCVQAMGDVLELVAANSLEMRQQMYRKGLHDGFHDAINRSRVALVNIEAEHFMGARANTLGETLDGAVDSTSGIDLISSDSAPGAPAVLESEALSTDAGSEPEDIPESESLAVEVSGAAIVEGRDDLSGDPDDGAVDESDSSAGDVGGVGNLGLSI